MCDYKNDDEDNEVRHSLDLIFMSDEEWEKKQLSKNAKANLLKLPLTRISDISVNEKFSNSKYLHENSDIYEEHDSEDKRFIKNSLDNMLTPASTSCPFTFSSARSMYQNEYCGENVDSLNLRVTPSVSPKGEFSKLFDFMKDEDETNAEEIKRLQKNSLKRPFVKMKDTNVNKKKCPNTNSLYKYFGTCAKNTTAFNQSTETCAENVHAPMSTSYYNVLWCKQSARKHKKWEGDGILIINKLSAVLKDLDGKEITRGSGYKIKEVVELEEGSLFQIGGKECEIQSIMSENDYKKWRVL